MKSIARLFFLFTALMTVFIFINAGHTMAQTITVINSTPCFSYVSIRNLSGSISVSQTLTPWGQYVKNNASGSGIGLIKAGPTCSIPDPFYRKKVHKNAGLAGSIWRFEIHTNALKLFKGESNGTWKLIDSYPGDLDACYSCTRTKRDPTSRSKE